MVYIFLSFLFGVFLFYNTTAKDSIQSFFIQSLIMIFLCIFWPIVIIGIIWLAYVSLID